MRNSNIEKIIFFKNMESNEGLSLKTWIDLFLNEELEVFPNNCFPSENIRNDFINEVNRFTEEEFKNILRKMLVQSWNYGREEDLLEAYENDEKIDPKLMKTEYFRRLSMTGIAFEGISWILDLLPLYPEIALKGLNAYHNAHFLLLPDFAEYGLTDAEVMIRARYLENDYDVKTLLSLSPREFEYLICELYDRMGYCTKLTPRTKDGGKDVTAQKSEVGKKERIHIECKRYSSKVTVATVRALRGVVSKDDVSKGVLIGVSGFTKGTIKFCEDDSRLELIKGEELIPLLNEYLGKNWFEYIPLYSKKHLGIK